MEKLRNSRGITLIALIITILVLLILAGVSIKTLVGNNGIMEKARWSEFLTEYEKVDEAKKIYAIEQKMNKYGKEKPKFTLKSLFINTVYAADIEETIYPVNKKYPMWKTAQTLKNTICK